MCIIHQYEITDWDNFNITCMSDFKFNGSLTHSHINKKSIFEVVVYFAKYGLNPSYTFKCAGTILPAHAGSVGRILLK